MDARVVRNALQHLASPHNRGGRGAAEGCVVGRGEVACSAVSGNLWHRPAWSPGWPRHPPLSDRPKAATPSQPQTAIQLQLTKLPGASTANNGLGPMPLR
jgi:hypothetical protein